MFFFHVQALYNVFSLIFSWFALANIWLTFSIIIDLLPAQTPAVYIFGTPAVTHWVNLWFKWIYLGFLALQFVLALGNRPKGFKIAYAVTLWVYAFLAVYLIVCSIWLTVLAFTHLSLEGATVWDRLGHVLTGPANVLLASLVATFGIYFFASFLYRDPWHMFSSFPQYLLLAPSFTNVLNVYAFCNLHDVSWGTKGSDKAEVLPSISSKKGKEDAPAVVDDIEKNQADIDVAFKETVDRAVMKLDKKEEREKPTLDDQNRTFRTNFVAFWMLSNAALAVAIENINGLGTTETQERTKQNIYFSIILWSTFGLAMVRFIGCVYYFFKRNLFRCCRRN